MDSCKTSFLWINGEILVRISFGVLMESFLWEHFWCGSLEYDWRSILRKRVWGWSHGCIEVSASLRSWQWNSQNYRKTLFSSAYVGCPCIGCIYASCLCTWCVQYVGYQCTRRVQWIKSWRFVVELMTSYWRLKQVPDLHSMSSDLSLRHWYG